MLRAAQILRRLSFFSRRGFYEPVPHGEKEAEDEFVERRSRFIGRVKPVKTEEDAVLSRRANLSIGTLPTTFTPIPPGGNIRRYSDDGEPQGTAGVPVLEVLQKKRGH